MATGSFTRRRTNNWTENTLKRPKRGRPREMRRLTKLLPIQVTDSLARAFGLMTAPAPPQQGGQQRTNSRPAPLLTVGSRVTRVLGRRHAWQ